jgi:hypothetical protein
MRYQVETNLQPAEVMDRARVYFGEGGIGLTLEQSGEDMLFFTGGGGSVGLSVIPGPPTSVEFVEKEWEYQMKEFARGLPR